MGCCWWETSCLLAHTPGSCLVGTFYTPYKMTSVIYHKYWNASHFCACYLMHYLYQEQNRFTLAYSMKHEAHAVYNSVSLATCGSSIDRCRATACPETENNWTKYRNISLCRKSSQKLLFRYLGFNFSQNFWEGCSTAGLMDELPLHVTGTEVHVMLTDDIICTAQHTVPYSVVDKY